MAETLGAVASILQLVDTALKAREYIQDFRHAPQEQQKLLSEIDDLRPLLIELRNRITASAENGVLQQMKNPLAAFKITMEHFTQKLRPIDGVVSKVSKQLQWAMWNKKEAKEYLATFEQFKSLLNSWLLLGILDTGRQDHDNLLKAVDDVSNEQRQEINSRKRAKIIDWLSPINFFVRQADVSSDRQPGTGEWLLADSRFRDWASGSGGTLWCRGIPGAGKTVLASMVINYLRTQPQNENFGVACIYLNHKETELQTPSNLISGLWRQLVFSKELNILVHSLYERHSEQHTRPSFDEIYGVLRSAIADWSKVYIVVDALDEYPEHWRRILIEKLAVVGPTVNVMLTSRPHITLNVSLPNFETLDIRANNEDIQRYVDERIRLSSRLSKHVETRPEFRQEIHTKISSSVDGMFLLVKLHIESLGTKSTVKAVREGLKNLPKDLDRTYENAMKRIEDQNEEDREIAHSVLTWVANAKRLLTVRELQEALAIEPGTKFLDDDNILDIEIILSVCAGLVIVEESTSVVRLVHYTTQNYLDSIQATKFSQAQTNITRSLLTFLEFNEFADLSRYNSGDGSDDDGGVNHGLIGYCQYCLVHAAGQPEGGEFGSILQAALQMGHESILRLLINNGADVNLLGPYGSALQTASAKGDETLVGLLIEHGANLNVQSGRYGTALQAAAYHGHKNIAKLLIEMGAHVNEESGIYSTALQAASCQGHDGVVRLLIEAGAELNLQGGKSNSALQAASYWGHESTVSLLLERGADVNVEGGRYGSPVQAALRWGYDDIVKLLVEKGADVNLQGGQYDKLEEQSSPPQKSPITDLLIVPINPALVGLGLIRLTPQKTV
ncbi:hypothetical protein C8R44DRAFT_983359 [Mycena epipterygia]|nr:hypothetical protein C8R44DRAFT_983359 [Mycena epipterygia]